MTTKPIVIAIDGLAAAGKGTLARRIAEHYDYAYLDSGKLYRLIARTLLQNKSPLTNENATAIAQKFSDEIPFHLITDPSLMQDEVGIAASTIAAFPEVRSALKTAQKQFAASPPAAGAVIDGRDIGTVICPNAQVKLYITADAKTRTLRRLKELGKQESSYAETLAAIQKRDSDDQNRPIAPLKKAPDATEIDTSKLTIEQALQACLKIINEKIASL